MKVCVKCGEENATSRYRCFWCGRRFDKKRDANKRPPICKPIEQEILAPIARFLGWEN